MKTFYARPRLAFAAWLLLGIVSLPATTLPPELKAYDFAQAYYVEDGGVVIDPYRHGFETSGGVQTPEGIRLMPGETFRQVDPERKIIGEYRFLRLNANGHRAFFHEDAYRYHVVTDSHGRPKRIRDGLAFRADFYLTRFRALEPFDHVFTNIELHPGEQAWRVSKN